MDFREYASRETTALLEQLLARAASSSADRLRSVREAFDAAAQAMEAGGRPSSATTREVEDLVQRLAAAAGAAVAAAAQRIQDEARTATEAVERERDDHRARADQLAARHAQLEAHVQALEADLRSEKERAETADRDLDSALEAHRELEAALLKAEAAGREQAEARCETARELHDTRALLEEALAESARLGGQLDHELAEKTTLTSDLYAAKEEVEHLEAARTRAEASLAQVERDLDATRTAHDTAVAEAAALRDEINDRLSEHASLRSELDDLQGRLREVHTELETLAAERTRLAAAHDHQTTELEGKQRELATTISERDRLAAARDAVIAERDAIAAERRAVAEQRDLLAAERDELLVARAALNATVEAGRARLEALEQESNSLTARIAQLQSALEEATHARQQGQAPGEQVAARPQDSRTPSLLTEVLAAIDQLARATTVAEVLTALVQQMAREFPRVALFRVKGNRLEGEQQVGFEATTDVATLVLPMNIDALPTRAATTGVLQRLPAGELSSGRLTPFGPTPAAAVALPVIVHGEPLAVIYAEQPAGGGDAAAGPDSPATIFGALLVRHATVLLMQLTNELKTLAALREYAAMLLQEAREMHAADTQAGRQPDDVRRRLEDTIDCARQLYAQRAQLEGTSAAVLFDEQIAAALELEPDTPFARDLMAAARLHDAARTLSGRQAAEAS